MLDKIYYSPTRFYKNGSEYPPIKLFLDALFNSTKFDLLLGYFTSSAINILSYGFASFLHRGGIMRVVLNQQVLHDDIEAISKSKNKEINNLFIDLSDLGKLQYTLSKPTTHFFECLAWLIKNNRVQFQFIKLKKDNGISHFKDGIFSDGKHRIGFTGSCNFTAGGLLKNLERTQVILDWDDIKSRMQIDELINDFESFFHQKSELVDYLDIDQIKNTITNTFEIKEIDQLLHQEKDLLLSIKESKYISQQIDNAIAKLDSMIQSPKFPYQEGPREYQQEAYNQWLNNNRKGIFAMATGTGKTITSLNCILNEYTISGAYRAIIVVPTIALVEQWKAECKKFKFQNIISVTTKVNWSKDLAIFNTSAKFLNTSFIVIVTYSSFSKSKFQSYFTQLPLDTIFIADETHNLGSKNIQKILNRIHLQKRIGLSATPQRHFDELGNSLIEEFFNDKPPYIVSFSMKQALDLGCLCQYFYFPHIVYLTEQEMDKYKEISLQLFKMGIFDKQTGKFKSSPEIEMKLLERKRIIHKAFNKLSIFKKILKAEYDKKGSLKYTLVYVPEGIEANYDKTDYYDDTDEEIKLINHYTHAVSSINDNVMVKQFTGNTTNRDDILKLFEQSQIHVLISMKCLDEGVDIPRSELAIFCASTGNPRQFIQRRGRVLRLHSEKRFATIHDLIVVPICNDENSNRFDMERGLVKKEIERVISFSKLSKNEAQTYETLKPILDCYKLNLYE